MKMPRLLKEFLVILPVLVITLGLGQLTTAQAGYFNIPSKLCGEFPCPPDGSAESQTKHLVNRVVDNVRYIIGAVAIVAIVIAGIKLVTAGGNEEDFTKQKETIIWAIVGLGIVAMAGEVATIFDPDRGGFFRDANVALQKRRLFTRTVEIVITFMKYVIGSVAVIYIVRSGLRLVLLGDQEEEVAKEKKSIFYGLLGLVVILLANPIINKVFFKIDPGTFPGVEAVRPAIDTKAFAMEVAGMTNLVAAIAGPFALLSLVAGALMYTLAAGEEEKIGKAKKIITWSLIGLVIIYGAFAIVSTFITRRFEGI